MLEVILLLLIPNIIKTQPTLRRKCWKKLLNLSKLNGLNFKSSILLMLP